MLYKEILFIYYFVLHITKILTYLCNVKLITQLKTITRKEEKEEI